MFSADTVADLRRHQPARDEPADFDDFWRQTLADARAVPVQAEFTPFATRLMTIDTFDVSFRGYGGHRIRAWLNIPRIRPARLPCVVEYVDYGGGRGVPHNSLLLSAAGYAHLIMDNRGQGSDGQSGDTPDVIDAVEPHAPGFMTLGLESPQHYYFRRVYADAVRAVDAARSCPLIDPDRIAIAGHSVGGGVCLAVSGLVPDVQAVLPSVPLMCDFQRAVSRSDPYFEIALYLRTNPAAIESAKFTLSYFDALNFAARANAPALFAVALMDIVGPPKTVFAAYNHYQGEKDIRVWEFHTHQTYVRHHGPEQLAFLGDLAGMNAG